MQNCKAYGLKTYRLAKCNAYNIVPFGPLFTLAQAQAYQADLILGGFNVLVININTDRGV